MHITYSPEAFRRDPKLGVGLGVILLCIAAVGLAVEYPEYKSLGNAPVDLTVEQAVPSPGSVPDRTRWVRLPGGLVPVCGQVLHEMSGASIVGTRILAADESRQRWFYLRIHGDQPCPAVTAPMTGMLKKADSGLPAWLKDKGMTVPESPFPLMEMSVDETPGDVRILLFAFLAMGILGAVTAGVFATREPERPMRRPTRAGLAVFAAVLAVSSSACSKTTLTGRVNVPGNEGGPIAIRVIPEKEIADYLQKKVPEALAALDERRTAYERLAKEQDTAIRDYQMASGGATASSVTKDGVRVTSAKDGIAGDRQYTYDPTQHTAAEAERLAREGLAEAEQQRAANTTRFGSEKSSLSEAMASGRTSKEAAGEWVAAWETDMLADVPLKGTVVYTDAKGAFKVKVPRGGKVALFASGDFRTGNRTYHRGWAVWVKADSSEKAVTLDENNMLLAEPSESVLK